MARTKTKTPTPLYAVLGAGDLVAERLRSTAAQLDTDPKALQSQVQDQVQSVQSAAHHQFDSLLSELRALPDRAQAAASGAFGQAATVYGDLADRGETLVTRVRNQQSTQDAASAAKTTKSQAKATVTTARKQSAQAAKATSTTAKKQTDKVAAQANKTAEQANKTAEQAGETGEQANKTGEQANKTAAQAGEGVKATKTTAKRTTKKATNATAPRAKATRTSAGKTAEATTKAVSDAAANVGD